MSEISVAARFQPLPDFFFQSESWASSAKFRRENDTLSLIVQQRHLSLIVHKWCFSLIIRKWRPSVIMHVTGNSVPPYWTSFDPFHSSIDFFYRKFVFYFVLKISASSRLLDNEYKLPWLSSSNRLMSDSKTSSDYSVKCTERCYIALVVDDLCLRSYLELEWGPFGIELNWRKNPLGSLSTSDVCAFLPPRESRFTSGSWLPSR